MRKDGCTLESIKFWNYGDGESGDKGRVKMKYTPKRNKKTGPKK